MIVIHKITRTHTMSIAAFCKLVLRNAVCTYFRALGRKRKREISLEYLTEKTSFEAHSTDNYFVQHDTPTDLTIFGQLVTVDNEHLAKALLCLSDRRRGVILLRYYLHFNDVQIAALYGSPRSTIQYQKQAALKQLRKEMEEMKDELLVPYETIEKAVGGDTASLLAIQQHYNPFIGYLSNGDTDLREALNSKLLEAILKFKMDYQPPSK